MTGSLTKQQLVSHVASIQSNTTGPVALANAFQAFVAANAAAVGEILNAVRSGNWSSAEAVMSRVVKTPGYTSLSATAQSLGYGTLGLVTAVDGGLIVSGKGLAGLISSPLSLSRLYSLEELGISVGLTEGAVLEAGLYASTDAPADAGGWEVFAELSGAVAAGVAVEGFHSLYSGGNGVVVLLSTGEEVELSAGVGYVFVQEL